MKLRRDYTLEFITALDGLSDRVVAYRVLLEKGILVAEIKGLKDRMLRLRQRIDNIQRLASEADSAGSFLESELTDFHGQFMNHRDDLVAAAGVVGNSSGGYSEQVVSTRDVADVKSLGSEGFTVRDTAPLTVGSTASTEPRN